MKDFRISRRVRFIRASQARGFCWPPPQVCAAGDGRPRRAGSAPAGSCAWASAAAALDLPVRPLGASGWRFWSKKPLSPNFVTQHGQVPAVFKQVLGRLALIHIGGEQVPIDDDAVR